jgi:Ca2+-dependent lipid-binding protein
MSTASFIVVVEKATGLRNAAGMMGTSDPYAVVSTPTAPAVLNERTQVVKNDLSPVWKCCMLVVLPTAVPAMLKVEVHDSNKGKDVSLQQTFNLFISPC